MKTEILSFDDVRYKNLLTVIDSFIRYYNENIKQLEAIGWRFNEERLSLFKGERKKYYDEAWRFAWLDSCRFFGIEDPKIITYEWRAKNEQLYETISQKANNTTYAKLKRFVGGAFDILGPTYYSEKDRVLVVDCLVLQKDGTIKAKDGYKDQLKNSLTIHTQTSKQRDKATALKKVAEILKDSEISPDDVGWLLNFDYTIDGKRFLSMCRD